MADALGVGTRLIISAERQVRVVTGDAGRFPVVLEGDYITARTRVSVVGATTGHRVEIAPADGSPAPWYAVPWPAALEGDSHLELHIRDAEREQSGPRIPAITLEAPGESPAQATRLSWQADPEHGLFAITVLTVPAAEVADRRLVPDAFAHVPWDKLAQAAEYRVVIREHDGRAVVRPVTQLRLRPVDGRLPSDSGDAASAVLDLRRALTSGNRDEHVPATILGIDDRADGPALAGELCRLLYDVFDRPVGVHRRAKAVNFAELGPLAAQAIGRAEGSRDVRETLSYLALYGVVDQYFRVHRFRDRGYLDEFFTLQDFFTPQHGQELLAALRESPAYVEGSFSASMVDALVTSSFDRSAAAPLFEQARQANREMWDHLWIDVGASSYLSDEFVRAHVERNPGERDRLAASFSLLTPMPKWAPGDYMYMCSCDRFYFRVYFPFWLAMAEYLKARRVSFHFLLNGPEAEVAEAVQAADDLRRQMGRLRGIDPDSYAANISFSSVPVPENLSYVRTFYACSRFLLARRLADEYQGPLVISDTDMFFREDPKRYLGALDLDRLGLSARRGFETLKPWRRFIANALVLPFSDRAHSQFSVVEDYVLAGLPLERTWMLDQNALAYLVERTVAAGESDLLTDIDRLGRPTVAETIKGLLQDEQRRLAEPPRDPSPADAIREG